MKQDNAGEDEVLEEYKELQQYQMLLGYHVRELLAESSVSALVTMSSRLRDSFPRHLKPEYQITSQVIVDPIDSTEAASADRRQCIRCGRRIG